MPADDQPRSLPAPTFRDLLAAAEAARRVSTPPPAPAQPAPRPAARPHVPDQDAA
ncbi:hypothetical protein [Actinacidiphila epipremni]|jgi:hypothetical protein|uniref:Uncharacterized protein n=1 Tax=Actinacidiphila epipremni TaxID=2053013 RepID=A0ABX0ZWP6_9ACTN|nr:hypothetical protein [Actinacidiphila epipremni]NJP47601.1 hypothetical protein [Actinacidiphila epipremni]